ncbi:MAG: hypothetical protein NVS1B3_16820 [Candidatus Dormibacteraceae bacterium]
MSTLRTVDDKGRLTLGREFAGRAAQVEKGDDGLVIRFVRVVPHREAWLWETETAKGSVDRGLGQARDGELNSGPNLAAAFKFAEEIPEEE